MDIKASNQITLIDASTTDMSIGGRNLTDKYEYVSDTDHLLTSENQIAMIGLQLPNDNSFVDNLSYESDIEYGLDSSGDLCLVTIDGTYKIMKTFNTLDDSGVEDGYVGIGTVRSFDSSFGDDDWLVDYNYDNNLQYEGRAGVNMQGRTIDIQTLISYGCGIEYCESFIVDAFDANQLTISASLIHEHATKQSNIMVLALYPDSANEYEPYKLAADPVTLGPVTNEKRRYSATLTFYDQVLADGLLTDNKVTLYFLYKYTSEDNTDYAAIGKLTATDIKIEKGNVPTDWTPSPEDVEADIAEVHDTMISQKTDIIANCESIILSSLEKYVKTGEYDEFKKTVSSQLEILSDQIDMKFSTVSKEVSDVNGELQTKLNEFYKYISFDGENGITIGSSDSSIKLIVDNDGILFTKDGVTFGSWDGNNFHTGNIVVDVNERAQFGNFAYIPNSDGSLSFMKVGD